MNFRLSCVLAAALGYLALTQEMLWLRAVSYATGGHPGVFGQVLGSFLLGVALGALVGEYATKHLKRPMMALSIALGAAAVMSWLGMAAPAYGFMQSRSLGMGLIYTGIAASAALSGVSFPVLCHLALQDSVQRGSSASVGIGWIYLANIIGSTLAPLFTGFVLFNLFPLPQLVLIATVTALMLAAGLGFRRLAMPLAAAVAVALVVIAHPSLYENYFAHLHFKDKFSRFGAYNDVVETRSGVIAVFRDTKREDGGPAVDMIFGGGVYDGTFNVDPLNDSNMIRRGYVMASLHRDPKRVLEIGMSGASWTSVMTTYEKVESMDVVEINPGYIRVAEDYPASRDAMRHPKVKLHVDDGRRWLNAHPDAKFDFILMNASFYWREGATNLLSADFLEIARAHLLPGGVLYYNTTGSDDVIYTATTVFPYVTKYLSFIAVSDAPFNLTPDERRANFARFVRDGKPVFDLSNPALAKLHDDLVAVPLLDLGERYRSRTDLLRITDDNLATEFKEASRAGVNPARRWSNLFDRVRW